MTCLFLSKSKANKYRELDRRCHLLFRSSRKPTTNFSKGIQLYRGGSLSNFSSTSRRDKKGSLFQRPLVRTNQTESSDHFAHALYCCVHFIHVIRIDSVTWQSQLSAKRVQIVILPYLSAATMQLFRFSGQYCYRFEPKQDGMTTLKWIICGWSMYLFYFHFVRVGRPAGRREMSLFSIKSPLWELIWAVNIF